ncbi:MAG: hypothetical protein LQ345_004338 [Seirophora villosa]|nr:MAG: hypothetical protein LQ345_004338 [Seirophora villosa]
MLRSIHPYLTQPDNVVLNSLSRDLHKAINSKVRVPADDTKEKLDDDQTTVQLLSNFNDEAGEAFQPTVFTGWDQKDIPYAIERLLVRPYTTWAKHIVRRPTDVVFLTHILIYLATSAPSAVYLFLRFSWSHALFHWIMQAWYCGSFTLMLHNHIHNNGLLSKEYAWFDNLWPYILEPLMGHTWDSYYYHHVKHHHHENNGPGDLSSTIRYQRDELLHFMHYVARFVFLVWIELPLYFWRKNKISLALRTLGSELLSYAFIVLMARFELRATVFVLIMPLVQMRIGMMVGNWGQHALVDEVEPDSDFRSSITLIDVPQSNRHCFNDGYHTSHHLNPRRHWRDHPVAFIKDKPRYSAGRALVFHNIDYIMMTVTLLRKDYMHLASCLVPMGDQIGMSQEEVADMLRTKTKKFTEEDIMKKYGQLG